MVRNIVRGIETCHWWFLFKILCLVKNAVHYRNIIYIPILMLTNVCQQNKYNETFHPNNCVIMNVKHYQIWSAGMSKEFYFMGHLSSEYSEKPGMPGFDILLFVKKGQASDCTMWLVYWNWPTETGLSKLIFSHFYCYF